MESVYCAACRNKVPLDSDHVEIDAKTIWMEDRDDLDEYVMHLDCWRSISDGWMDPV